MRSRIGLMVLCMGLIVLSSGNLFAQERWVYRYNGPGNYYDKAHSIIVGEDGNLYTAGESEGSGTYDDFTVISLTPLGDERWVYCYSGTGSGYDEASSLVYGSDGNIYVAGYTWGSSTGTDFTVISLTSEGTERWVYHYSGPGNSADKARSLVYASDGNIYVVGGSYDSSTDYDFTVISLTSGGTERWVYRYNGPGNRDDWGSSLVNGSDGNIYAAGYSWGSGSNADFTVISLTASGTERWVYHYNGPGNDDDGAGSIATGRDGNLYVAGASIGSGTSTDLTVISFTPSGGERWLYRYNGPGDGGDWPYSLVYGSDDNIYVGGLTIASASSLDFAVISLTASGTERWVYRYNGPGNGSDWANSVVMGTDGNLYAAGVSAGSGTLSDFTAISLTVSGTERWIYRYNGPGNHDDRARSIVAGTDGNLYAAGYSTGSGTWADFTVISLTPDVVGLTETEHRPSQSPTLGISASPVPAVSGVRIHYSLPKATRVTLSVHDGSGRLVKNLVNSREEVGSRTVFWNRRDQNGDELSSGIYFCRLTAGNFAATKKILVLK